MSEPTRAELLRIVALLEERHGVGVRGDELPRWLEELVIELANALRVGETRFYRDAAQWEALRLQVIPHLLAAREREKSLVALSAGCSTGEEAWTLAMLLAEAAPRPAARSRMRVIGVDRSEAALVTARAATYDVGSHRQLPADLAQRFLIPAVDGSVRVVPELQGSVTFQTRDLTRGVPAGRYAVIVCKNVLIYFGDEAQRELVADLLRALSDDGVLLVARSEVPIVRALGAKAQEIAPGVTAFKNP